MTVVVTGAAGFIGRRTVAALLRQGFDVVAIDRRPCDGLPAIDSPGLQVVRADLLDSDPRVFDALHGAAAVIHLAGRPGVRESSPDIEHDRHCDNVTTTRVVLDHADSRVPVVVASSSSVYGGACGVPSAEHHPLRPRGGYARSKVRCERQCVAAIAAGRRITVVRPFTVVGTGQRADMALARWIAAAATRRPMTVYGDPLRSRDLTDVDLVADALVDLLSAAYPGVLNLGSGRPHTLSDITTTVARTLDVEPQIRVRPALPDDPPHTHADVRRLGQVLGRTLDTDLDAVVRAAARSLAGAPPAAPVR